MKCWPLLLDRFEVRAVSISSALKPAIRAVQGHSFAVEDAELLQPFVPPAGMELFHGTKLENVASIWEQGLSGVDLNRLQLQDQQKHKSARPWVMAAESLDRPNLPGIRSGSTALCVIDPVGLSWFRTPGGAYCVKHVPVRNLKCLGFRI